jgi:hypothetical protein
MNLLAFAICRSFFVFFIPLSSWMLNNDWLELFVLLCDIDSFIRAPP